MKNNLIRKVAFTLEFKYYVGIPNPQIIDGLFELHKHVFDGSVLTIEALKKKSNLLTIVAIEENNIVGFKIGYEIEEHSFFSWIGGVHENSRNLGIASKMMNLQHSIIKERGYKKVKTHSRNNRKAMLILNLKHGFDIIDTFKTEKGSLRIVLEKVL